jgi:hypothetical protein
MAVALVAPL